MNHLFASSKAQFIGGLLAFAAVEALLLGLMTATRDEVLIPFVSLILWTGVVWRALSTRRRAFAGGVIATYAVNFLLSFGASLSVGGGDQGAALVALGYSVAGLPVWILYPPG
jgi:hypothetical protein